MADEADEGGARSGFDVIRASARIHEPDRYLAALLSPRSARDHLIALAAFTGEINKIGRVVSEPHLAEIRLQWWRDAVLAVHPSPTGNPIADAFVSAFSRQEDLRPSIERWLDAVAQTFYQAPPEDEAELCAQLEVLEGVPFLLAARLCGVPPSEALNYTSREAGFAYGLARLGLSIAHNMARGRWPLPQLSEAGLRAQGEGAALDQGAVKAYIAKRARAALEQVRSRFQHGSPAQRAAILPLALVEPYLRACERQDHDLTRDLADVAPLVRVWRIWRAHLTGRL